MKARKWYFFLSRSSYLLEEYDDPELYDRFLPPLRPLGDFDLIHGSDHSSPLPCLSSTLCTITSRLGLFACKFNTNKKHWCKYHRTTQVWYLRWCGWCFILVFTVVVVWHPVGRQFSECAHSFSRRGSIFRIVYHLSSIIVLFRWWSHYWRIFHWCWMSNRNVSKTDNWILNWY